MRDTAERKGSREMADFKNCPIVIQSYIVQSIGEEKVGKSQFCEPHYRVETTQNHWGKGGMT